ncbi:MAG TPA: tetratricopeptide repeat protein [Thermosulfurimonas dismutans]|uniref:Tetratricopeptide repeat protein n=1 Tax=Thermosulfurimonas dismutans TaxID=999894 RepID=A0A7C3GCV3_9BACT|nr:tetratricopeptide repeat protein [Thermosulfurimonas dismutans]
MRTTIRWPWKGLLLSLLVWLVLGTTAQAGRRAEAYYHFLVAMRAYQEGKLSLARKELYKVLQEDPRALYPRKLLIEIYGRLGQYEKAETLAHEALKQAPDDKDLLLLLARIYLSEKRPARAAVTLEKVLEKDPTNEEALGLLLSAYLTQHDLSGALSSLERLLKVHPRSYTLWLLKARVLARAGKPQEAREAYLRAAELSSYRLEIVMEAGSFLRRMGDLPRAETLYREFLRRNPQDIHAYQALIQILVTEEKWEEAEKLLREALQKYPENTGFRFFLGVILERQGRKQEALRIYGEISPGSPFYRDALQRIYDLTRELKGDQAALSFLEKLIHSQPQDPQIYFFAASAAEQMDYCPQGLKFVQAGLKRFPGDRSLILTQGLLLSCLGRLREALNLVEPLLERYPDDPLVLNFVGYTYAELGENLEVAERYIRKALKKQPQAGYIVDSLAWVLYKQGRLKEALREIQRAVKLSPKDAVILEHEGDILQALGRCKEACEVYRKALSLTKHRRDRERIRKKVASCPEKPSS